MMKFPKVRRIGHPETDGLFDASGALVIQEKIDGSNFRIYLDVDEDNSPIIEYGSRNVSYVNVPDEDIPKAFRPTIEFVNDTLNDNQVVGLVRDEGPVTMFGEALIKHTLDYDWENTPQFLGFDVWSHRDEEWRHPLGALNIIESVGLSHVPVYGIPGLGTMIPVDEFDASEWEEPESHYRNGIAEGIIVRNTATKQKAKLVTEAFAEKKTSAKSGVDTAAQSDAQKMAEKYVGQDNRRIRKQITKLTEDEGRDLAMELMPNLGPSVIEDIGLEEGHNILLEDYEVDFHQFRKVVNRKCVKTIKSMMKEQVTS